MIARYGKLLARIGIAARDLENFEALVQDMQEDAELEEVKEYRPQIEGLRKQAAEFGLEQSARIAQEMLDAWTVEGLRNKVFRHRLSLHLRKTLDSELDSVWMRRMNKDQADLYLSHEPFGASVVRKLPKATSDIEEASKCLALERPTATVFHLMRVMEIGVQQFGRKLGVRTASEKMWQNILDEIDKAIRGMPESNPVLKKRKARFAEVSAHLFNVKMAWRNPVMHPKSSYTQEQAVDIYEHVKRFASHLAQIL
jgi:hypothetical protein